MAMIPDITPQFQPSLNAEVTSNGVHFKFQKDPVTVKTTIIPDELMAQVVALWLQAHPQEALEIVRAVKNKQRTELDVIRSIQSSKNNS